MAEDAVTPPPTPAASGDEELKEAKAEILRQVAKILGAIALAVLPAFAVWQDGRGKAETTKTAVATEAATNSLSYDELAGRIDVLEQTCLRRREPRPLPAAVARTSTVIEHRRPAPPAEMVKQYRDRAADGDGVP